MIVYLVQLGISSFLLKEYDPKELEKAIVTVSKGGQYYNANVRNTIEKHISKEVKLAGLNITPRESQVMLLMKEGRSNKEIGCELGLTTSTVESYRKSLIRKTDCRNTAELISLAYRTGILPPK